MFLRLQLMTKQVRVVKYRAYRGIIVSAVIPKPTANEISRATATNAMFINILIAKTSCFAILNFSPTYGYFGLSSNVPNCVF